MLTRRKNETMAALVNHAASMSNLRKAAEMIINRVKDEPK